MVKTARAHSPRVITHRTSAWYDSKRKVVQRVKETATLCRSLRQRRVFKLAVCVVQMQHLKVQLGHEALESFDGIQNFNTLCVGVITHFERSGHSVGHPSPEKKQTAV